MDGNGKGTGVTGVATPLHFGRAHIALILGANGLGDFVGMRSIIWEGVDPHGRDAREFTGWLIAGTEGYAEVSPDGGVCVTGVWTPPVIIGE